MMHPIRSLIAAVSMLMESLSMAVANIAANKLRSMLGKPLKLAAPVREQLKK